MPKRKLVKVKTRRRLPHYKNVTIPNQKIGNYLLNPDKSNGKSDFFASIGYNMKMASRMEDDIRRELGRNKASVYEPDEYGRVMMSVVMEIGITQK